MPLHTRSTSRMHGQSCDAQNVFLRASLEVVFGWWLVLLPWWWCDLLWQSTTSVLQNESTYYKVLLRTQKYYYVIDKTTTTKERPTNTAEWTIQITPPPALFWTCTTAIEPLSAACHSYAVATHESCKTTCATHLTALMKGIWLGPRWIYFHTLPWSDTISILITTEFTSGFVSTTKL